VASAREIAICKQNVGQKEGGLRIGPIQRNGAAPAVIHTGRFFVLIPLKWLEKLTGVKDKYI
jgi:hypothetical protein